MEIRVQPLTEEQIRTFLRWEYSGPYALYNPAEEDARQAVRFFSDPANGYFALVDDGGELLGFCNFGADARVPGGNYEAPALDIGMGLRPDLTGQGQGELYAGPVFDFARAHFAFRQQRVTIAEFNKRAQRLCQKFGFRVCDHFQHAQNGRPFVIMTREIEHVSSG